MKGKPETAFCLQSPQDLYFEVERLSKDLGI
jgi:hypothetical protein